MFKLNGILQILDLIQFDTVDFGMVSRVWMLKSVNSDFHITLLLPTEHVSWPARQPRLVIARLPSRAYFPPGSHRVEDTSIAKTNEFFLRVEIAIEFFILPFARLPHAEVERAGCCRTK